MTRALAMAAMCALLAAGCTTTASRPSREADIAAITAFNKEYLGTINDGDFATLSRLTVEDHIIMIPGRPAIVGKAANDEANRRAFEGNRFAESWNVIDTVIDGDLGYQRGTFTTSAMPKNGGQTRTVDGKFLRIYRRLKDGSWTMVIDMFSGDKP
jgi:ketosteroid isomerase-like protein